MVWVVYVISILFVVIGVVLILYTDWMRKGMKRLLEKRNIRLFSPIPLVFGILLVIGAAWGEVFWFILLLGLVALAKGVYLLLGPKHQLNVATEWWLQKASDQSYRLCGVILLVLGMALLSWIR
jgi:uncharacterized protein YjeT (DUF2065 family)